MPIRIDGEHQLTSKDDILSQLDDLEDAGATNAATAELISSHKSPISPGR